MQKYHYLLNKKHSFFIFADHANGRKRGNISSEEKTAQLTSIGTGFKFNLWSTNIIFCWGFPIGDKPRLEQANSMFHFKIDFLSKSKKS